MAPVSFLILVTCIFSLFFLVSLTRGLSILLIFSKNQLKNFFFIIFLFSLLLTSSFCYFIEFFCLLLKVYIRGFPCCSDGKESACSAGDPSLIPGSGRSSGEGNGNPLQYSCLENPIDRGAWQATVHRVTKSQT